MNKSLKRMAAASLIAVTVFSTVPVAGAVEMPHARARAGFASRIWEGNCMAKTNSKGYFCDVPCGFMNAACENFFCAGCAAAGMPLPPNTEYPDVKKMHRGEDGDHLEVI